MKSAWKLTIAGVALTLLGGCAPPPDEVCEHLAAVYGDAEGKPSYLRDHDSCVAKFNRGKKSRGVNSYRREVECILASTKKYDIRECTAKEIKRTK